MHWVCSKVSNVNYHWIYVYIIYLHLPISLSIYIIYIYIYIYIYIIYIIYIYILYIIYYIYIYILYIYIYILYIEGIYWGKITSFPPNCTEKVYFGVAEKSFKDSTTTPNLFRTKITQTKCNLEHRKRMSTI